MGSAEGRHLQTFSSDHAPYQFNEKGKIPKGDKTTFKEMANGVPGSRSAAMLFSEGVQKGRSACSSSLRSPPPTMRASTDFIRAKARSPWAPMPTLRSGSDKEITIRWKDLHDNVGYNAL